MIQFKILMKRTGFVDQRVVDESIELFGPVEGRTILVEATPTDEGINVSVKAKHPGLQLTDEAQENISDHVELELLKQILEAIRDIKEETIH